MFKLKKLITKKNKDIDIDSKILILLINNFKKKLINKFDVKIEYLECRNLLNLSKNLKEKPFRLFVAYYLNNVRLIDNF